MMTIYAHTISPRLEYIAEVLFQDILGLDIRLTADQAELKSAEICLNYSDVEIDGVPYIRPQGLLSEVGISTAPSLSVDEKKQFFHTESDLCAFDVLSASFYLITRFEEYMAGPQAFDEHGRFLHTVSLAGKHDFLDRPIIDEWAMMLIEELKKRFPNLKSRSRSYRYLCTFDIDVAYAYGGRGWKREMAITLKNLMGLRLKRIIERKQVRRGTLRDPYDTYSQQKELIQEYDLDSIHFFLLGDYGPLDKNLLPSSKEMTDLISSVDSYSSIGIHPSMGSHQSNKKLKKEVTRLADLSTKEVIRSRQHFLAYKIPETFRQLSEVGIREDYSTGYAGATGFRASTCTPHKFYDLIEDKTHDLYLTPVVVMDSTLKDYKKSSPEEAKSEVSGLIDKVKKVNGTFVSLWHNHTIADHGEWNGWKEVFLHTISEARP